MFLHDVFLSKLHQRKHQGWKGALTVGSGSFMVVLGELEPLPKTFLCLIPWYMLG